LQYQWRITVVTTTDPQQPRPISWNNVDAYERFVGRWSRQVSREFVAWLNVAPQRHWLDVGCGTGALSQAILDRGDPAFVLGVDPSAEFLAHTRERITDPRARFEVGDARALPAGDGQFDAVVAGLVLNFVPADEQVKAVTEMRRGGKEGATVGAYLWDYAGEMQLIRYFWDAAAELDPATRESHEGQRCPICHPDPLAALFRTAGLTGVEVRAIDVPTVFRDFDDYWSPFLGGQGPAPAYAMSLDEERRTALRERIRADLPIAADGSISLIARAWAVRGTVPPAG
jgi:SAM-dependent methyltransferase